MRDAMNMAEQRRQLDRCRKDLLRSNVDVDQVNIQVASGDFEKFTQELGREDSMDRLLRVVASVAWLLDGKSRFRNMGMEGLIEFGRALDPAGSRPTLRTQSLNPQWENHRPVDPVIIPRALDRLFEWIQADGFKEMHPIEQMTVSQVRLIEIYPFELCCRAIVVGFSVGFLLERDYLLPSYRIEEKRQYEEAVSQAFQFSTLSLLTFNLQACQRSYDDQSAGLVPLDRSR
jgi:hypothetical protein